MVLTLTMRVAPHVVLKTEYFMSTIVPLFMIKPRYIAHCSHHNRHGGEVLVCLVYIRLLLCDPYQGCFCAEQLCGYKSCFLTSALGPPSGNMNFIFELTGSQTHDAVFVW